MENYIVINGKKAELTKEQLEKLGIKPERNNPFEKVAEGEDYFIIDPDGQTFLMTDKCSDTDNWYYDNAAYFNDEEFAEQMSLKWLLNRKLEKYAWDNNAEDVEWDGKNDHYYIFYNCVNKGFYVYVNTNCKTYNVVYFKHKEIAKNAIKDVIEPFMEEHPNFKW